MVSVSVDLSLDDISGVIQYIGSSDAERREVLDFVLDVDQSMADIHWSLDLVAELAKSVAQEDTDEDWGNHPITMPVGLPVPGDPEAVVHTFLSVKAKDLVTALVTCTPELSTRIYSAGLEARQEAQAAIEQAKAAVKCSNCGHTYGEHEGTCLAEEPGPDPRTGPFTYRCECSEFEAGQEKRPTDQCGLCGHTRNLHDGNHKALMPGPEACEGPFLGQCECAAFKEKEE